MIKLFNNKKGEDFLSIWWFLVLAIVGVGIVAGVYVFSTTELDLRQTNAEILVNSLINCFVDNSVIKNEFFNSFQGESQILNFCNLNDNVLNSNKLFYSKLELYQGENLVNSLFIGNAQFQDLCNITSKVTAENYPVCFQEELNVFYFKNNQLLKGKLKIISGSNNRGKVLSIRSQNE
jgi:hypothetical protein